MTSTEIATAPKTLKEAPSLAVIPPPHGGSAVIPHEFADPNDPQLSLPIFDFTALTSGPLETRSRLICDLGEVCRSWGFFILTNHGIPENLTKEMMEAFGRLFQLPEERKQRLKAGDKLKPVEYGINYSVGPDKIQYWREFFSIRVHPEFHEADDRDVAFRETSKEFANTARKVQEGLLGAISESLGLKADQIHKAFNLDDALQSLACNYYPPCPQPDLAMGLVTHSDATFITFLVENGISGLQIEHGGKWLKVENKIPNSLCVFVGDQLQILTNGKYKSAAHRASVNDRATRMTIIVPYNPPIDTVVAPFPELLKKEGQRPLYEAMAFRDYIELKRKRGDVASNTKASPYV